MSNTVGAGRQLFLSSEQGIPSNQPVDPNIDARGLNSDVVFTLRDPITSNWDTQGRRKRVQVALVNCVVPMSFYVVNRTNNVVVLTDDSAAPGISTTLTITPRAYTGNTLATELTAQSAAEGLNVVWTYSEADLKLEVAVPEGENYFIDAPTTTASRIIGSDPVRSINNLLVGGQTTLLQNPIDLGGPRYLVFDTDLPLDTSDASEAVKGMLAVIPVNAPAGALLYYSPTPPQYLETTIDQVNRLRIRITDEDHNLIDFQNIRWSAQLAFV